MDDKTLMMLLVAVATIVFFVFVYLASKTWTVAHIVMMVLVYLGGFTFLVMAAMTLKTHKEWRETYNRLEQSVDDEQVAVELLERGSAHNKAGELITFENVEDQLLQNKRDILSLQAEIDNVERDRGRVWRDVRPIVAGNSITLNIATAAPPAEDPAAPPADPAAPPAAAPVAVAHGIRPDAVLFAFREKLVDSADETQKLPVPDVYMGEFVVTATTQTSVTMVPSPASVELASRWAAPGTWVVYETMPGDRHEVYAGMDETRIRALFPKPPTVPAEIYERRIKEYLRHGLVADPTDPPEQVWTRVKFTQKFDVEVDSKDVQQVVESYFNATGQALPLLLQQGQKLSVEPGRELLLERSVAKRLIDEGKCTEIQPVFVRRLHDFEYLFRDFLVRRTDVVRRTAIVNADTAIQAAAAAKLQVNIDARNVEVGKLKSDLKGFEAERAILAEYSGKLAATRASQLAELSRLYNSNNDLAARIAQLQAQLAEQIDRRVKAAAEAGAATPAPVPAPTPAPTTPPAATPPAATPPAATPPAATPTPATPVP